MRGLTTLKRSGAAAVLAFAGGYAITRYGGQMRHRLKQANKRRKLQSELSHVMGEKARIEEELRQMEEE